MIHRRRFLFALSSVPALALLGCGHASDHDHGASGGERCALCGMSIAADSPWRAGLRAADGSERVFDTPKCLFRYRDGEEGRGASDVWVTEYYSGERREAQSLFYVLGSDVEGPMGADLVPIETRERAERFREEHQGARVLSFAQIDAAVLAPLFR